jgi:hypothetical protein
MMMLCLLSAVTNISTEDVSQAFHETRSNQIPHQLFCAEVIF